MKKIITSSTIFVITAFIVFANAPSGFGKPEKKSAGSAQENSDPLVNAAMKNMLYLHRAKAADDQQSRIADLQHAIDDFQTSIRLGAASKEELNRGLEKVATRANLEEATKILEKERHQ